MSDWIAKVTEAVILGMFKALTKPGILVGMLDAWHQANEPRQIIASKPNKDDEAFIKDAKNDGWSTNPPV